MALPLRPAAQIRVKWRAPEKDPRGVRIAPLLRRSLPLWALPCGESWHQSPTVACKCFWKAGPPSFRQPWLRLPGKAGLKLGLQGVGANIPGHTCDSSCEAGALLPVGRGTGVSWAPKRPGLGRPGCLGRAAAQSFLLGEKCRAPPAGGGVGARERPQGVRGGLLRSSNTPPGSPGAIAPPPGGPVPGIFHAFFQSQI